MAYKNGKLDKDKAKELFFRGLCPNCEEQYCEDDFTDPHKLSLLFTCSECDISFRIPENIVYQAFKLNGIA